MEVLIYDIYIDLCIVTLPETNIDPARWGLEELVSIGMPSL